MNTQKGCEGSEDEASQRGEKGGEVHGPVSEHKKGNGRKVQRAWGGRDIDGRDNDNRRHHPLR